MRVDVPHPWPTSAGEVIAIQDRLRPLVDPVGPASLAVVETQVVTGRAGFGYVPGLLAFRELPLLVTALERLDVVPDLIVCDGHGLAHPRRFGLACHVGLVTGVATVAVAKTPFVGTFDPPGPRRGDSSALRLDGAEVGRVLRTQDGVRPVFVSVGHRIGLPEACAHVLHLATRYRQPETTRHADHTARQTLAQLPGP